MTLDRLAANVVPAHINNFRSLERLVGKIINFTLVPHDIEIGEVSTISLSTKSL
jgi:hypothetical protein